VDLQDIGYEGMNYNQQAPDRDQRLAPVKTAMKLRVP